MLFNTGLGYSALNTARSALSCILSVHGYPVGNHPLTVRFMKGVFNMKPSIPRYSYIWDANDVLKKLALIHPAPKLALKQLTLKTVTLLAILSGQRVQTLHTLNIKYMTLESNLVQFSFSKLLKTSKPGCHLQPMVFQSFKDDKKLCIVYYLSEYLKRTKLLRRNQTQLFVSYRKPYNVVSNTTIARWIRTQLQICGVDTTKFKSHSTRGAATSAASKFLPVSTIMKSAGWRSETTFTKFYRKPLLKDETIANSLLQEASGKTPGGE